jgi:hypothetical protein
MRNLALIGISLVMAGCASSKRITTSDYLSQALIFPYGSYQHHVSIRMQTAAEGEKAFNFNGVVQLKPEMIRISALSHFGTTAFRITEDRKTGEIRSEVFVESMKKIEPKIREYYGLLRVLLTASSAPSSNTEKSRSLRWDRKDGVGRLLEATTVGVDPESKLSFLSYDKSGIPEKVLLQSPKFSVEIEVAGYEL